MSQKKTIKEEWDEIYTRRQRNMFRKPVEDPNKITEIFIFPEDKEEKKKEEKTI